MKDEQKGAANILAGIVIIILLCVIGFLIWWFGFRDTSNNNPVANTGQNTAQQTKDKIRHNWVTFFSGQTPAAQKEALLQNGSQFSQVIEAQAKTPTAKATTASVSDITLNGTGQATVTYTIDINKQPALKNQKGHAILTNGTWKVSDAAFCGLLQLSGNVPPNCPGGSSNSQAQQQQQSQQSQTQSQTPSSGQQSTSP